ncbi:MAG: MT-A70 family methyltransferase [Pelagibaca sp.]
MELTGPAGCHVAGPVFSGALCKMDRSFSSIEGVPLFRYGLIVADPPWAFRNWSPAGERKNASAQYECQSLEWLKSLRVGDIAAQDCLLWLWATNPMLNVAFDVMDAWGFKFKTAGHWSKKTVNGNQAFGTGYILRCAGEPFLIGTVGKPKTARNVRSVIEGPVREHSRKPDEAFAAAEHLCPDVPRIELFSRQMRPGWDVMGNQIERFAA